MLTRMFLFALVLMPLTATAQLAVPAAIHLDAVSIRENQSGAEPGTLSIPPHGDRILVMNSPMFRIIGFAFNKQRNDLIVGLPDWTRDLRWNIEATIAPESMDAFHHLTFEKQKEVLQQVLHDRCGLEAHTGRKEAPVYALTIAKSGTKLQPVPPTRPDANSPGWNMTQGAGKFEGRAVPIDALLYALSKAGLERQIIDRTGLTGRYDISLAWTPEDQLMSAPNTAAPDTGAAENSSAPSIFTAVQEQLGLKLEAAKAEVDAVIVTHIDKPSAN